MVCGTRGGLVLVLCRSRLYTRHPAAGRTSSPSPPAASNRPLPRPAVRRDTSGERQVASRSASTGAEQAVATQQVDAPGAHELDGGVVDDATGERAVGVADDALLSLPIIGIGGTSSSLEKSHGSLSTSRRSRRRRAGSVGRQDRLTLGAAAITHDEADSSGHRHHRSDVIDLVDLVDFHQRRCRTRFLQQLGPLLDRHEQTWSYRVELLCRVSQTVVSQRLPGRWRLS